ncbi:MAG: leucyl/phenylalanyl-tRNA--protein transferase [Paracoccus sp. (in: a-proteobacteria)]|nr:leucyl/phenylalanyl-tRNA--protein transferase [Paracoccus sp. (in: a-proteobacteria)]
MSGQSAVEELLDIYAAGLFPMARSADEPELYLFDPPERGILPVGGVHMSRSMRRVLRREGWRARANSDFARIVDHCAARETTWINNTLRALYAALYRAGHAHSLGVYAGDELIGGVFGVSLGRAFFAESMYSARPNASKAGLLYLSAHLERQGFELWDTQYPNPHLASLGGETISRRAYRARLRAALEGEAASFGAGDLPPLPA